MSCLVQRAGRRRSFSPRVADDSSVAEVPPLYLDYYQRLLQLDRHGAQELVATFLADHDYDVQKLYVDILMPALVHTGLEWERDRISVAHEHYISEVTRDLVYRYGPKVWVEPKDDAPVVLACCAPGERHTLGLMMVCDALRGLGMRVHTLGEGAPIEAIREFICLSQADFLCLSVSLDIHVPDAARLVRAVKQARPGLRVLMGGPAFGRDSGRAHAIGADHFAADALEVRALGPTLLADRPAPPPVDSP